MTPPAEAASAPPWRSRLVDYALCALTAACGVAGYDWLYREILTMCF
ncbi:MAG: hypothetical protein JSR83_13235 [Proteobacteria bacterium]|nr:hypothetical protein [Pseudomonadota bacterium]